MPPPEWNPLVDIGRTRSIAGVTSAGRWYDGQEVDALLVRAAMTSAASR
jgi:hypothetical protein